MYFIFIIANLLISLGLAFIIRKQNDIIMELFKEIEKLKCQNE